MSESVRSLSPPLRQIHPGANGTVKIADVPLAARSTTSPQVSCEFPVNFFRFDAGETAEIVSTVQPPTGRGTELPR